MIDAELLITLRKKDTSKIQLFSFTYGGIEHILTESQIKEFEDRYGIEIKLNKSGPTSYDLDSNFQNIDSIPEFFDMGKKEI